MHQKLAGVKMSDKQLIKATKDLSTDQVRAKFGRQAQYRLFWMWFEEHWGKLLYIPHCYRPTWQLKKNKKNRKQHSTC